MGVEAGVAEDPSGRNGSLLPTLCRGIVTPKSLSEINAGSLKILSSSCMVCRFWSVTSKFCESVMLASLAVSVGEDGGPEKYVKYTYAPSNSTTAPMIIVLFCFKKSMVFCAMLMEPIRANGKGVGIGAVWRRGETQLLNIDKPQAVLKVLEKCQHVAIRGSDRKSDINRSNQVSCTR